MVSRMSTLMLKLSTLSDTTDGLTSLYRRRVTKASTVTYCRLYRAAGIKTWLSSVKPSRRPLEPVNGGTPGLTRSFTQQTLRATVTRLSTLCRLALAGCLSLVSRLRHCQQVRPVSGSVSWQKRDTCPSALTIRHRSCECWQHCHKTL